MIKMQLARILIRENDDTHVVELREENGDRTFPIVIGLNEAIAIERRLLGKTPPRPQTHELLEQIISQTGFTLKQVSITELKNQTFYAKLEIANSEKTIEIDCRPSDALALGANKDVPIYVNEQILEQV